jgi:hypothetical protein
MHIDDIRRASEPRHGDDAFQRLRNIESNRSLWLRCWDWKDARNLPAVGSLYYDLVHQKARWLRSLASWGDHESHRDVELDDAGLQYRYLEFIHLRVQRPSTLI